jgi:hypothetical protein
VTKGGLGIGILLIVAIPVVWLSWNGRSTSSQDLLEGAAPLPDQLPLDVGQSEQNDLDRLSQITERYCRKTGNQVVTIFGSVPSSGTSFISIDYGLFNRLSDDGVAVLLAQDHLQKHLIKSEINTPSNPPPDPLRLRRTMLEVDEQVGRQMAKAGFRKEGFKEWLDCSANWRMGEGTASLSSDLRESAFLRGYESVSTQP